jgi:hypothetical protein
MPATISTIAKILIPLISSPPAGTRYGEAFQVPKGPFFPE